MSESRDFKISLGQEFGQGGLHTICNFQDETGPSGTEALPFGEGGAGTVYPCVYGEHRQPRAVKFLTIEPDTDGSRGPTEQFTSTFAIERKVLSQLSHSNINIFHEDGTFVDDKDRQWHFLITDRVPGPELAEALTNPAVDGETIYSVLADLFDAITYLHAHGVFHCDIKLDNIRMRGSSPQPYDAVLLDWGAAQVFQSPQAQHQGGQLPIEDQRLFVSTKRITHKNDQPRRRKTWSVTELREFVPRHEMHTIGVLIQDVLGIEGASEKLERALGTQGLRTLHEMARDLMASPSGSKDAYTSITELVSDFKKLHANYLAPAGVPELGLASEFHRSVPSATGRAVLTKRLSRLTSHRLVNRLHDVQQLEFTYETFPGATHSRFGHSTAVLRNTRYYLSHLLNDSRFRRQAERADLEATLLLAVLHDVGHYQLSHMFEDLASDQRASGKTTDWSEIDWEIPVDDTLFPQMLTAEGGGVSMQGNYGHAIHERAAELFSAETALTRDHYKSPLDIIRDEFGDATASSLMELHTMIYGQRSQLPAGEIRAVSRVLAGVLSSDIDADKSAYLVEDSLRTGVAYGLGVDLDGILGNLCMPTRDDLENPKYGTVNPLLGLRRAGVQAAQSVAINRNQMLSQVYWHPNNRAITSMIKYTIMRLLATGTLDMREFLVVAIFDSRASALQYLAARFDQVRTEDEARPLQGILGGGRALYQRVCEIKTALVDDAEALNDKLLSYGYRRILALQTQLSDDLTQRFKQLGPITPGELLIDIPSKEREKPSGDRGGQILVYDRTQFEGPGRPIHIEAPLYAGLKLQHKQMNRVSRVFLAPQVAARVTDDQERMSIARYLVDRLREGAGL